MRFNNNEFSFFYRIQLLDRLLFVENYFVVADKMDHNLCIRWQPEKIKIIQADDIELIIMSYFLMNCRAEVNDVGCH